MTIAIDKGVPMPAKSTGRPSIYPFKNMEVGDSFYVAGRSPRLMGGAITGAKKSNGFDFVSRAEGEGTRIWRIA